MAASQAELLPGSGLLQAHADALACHLSLLGDMAMQGARKISFKQFVEAIELLAHEKGCSGAVAARRELILCGNPGS